MGRTGRTTYSGSSVSDRNAQVAQRKVAQVGAQHEHRAAHAVRRRAGRGRGQQVGRRCAQPQAASAPRCQAKAGRHTLPDQRRWATSQGTAHEGASSPARVHAQRRVQC